MIRNRESLSQSQWKELRSYYHSYTSERQLIDQAMTLNFATDRMLWDMKHNNRISPFQLANIYTLTDTLVGSLLSYLKQNAVMDDKKEEQVVKDFRGELALSSQQEKARGYISDQQIDKAVISKNKAMITLQIAKINKILRREIYDPAHEAVEKCMEEIPGLYCEKLLSRRGLAIREEPQKLLKFE